jgi:hypothetical protein
MAAKSQKPYTFTELQAWRFEHTTHGLRKLNRDSLREFQRLQHPGITNARYREAGNSFELLAPRMMFLLRFREAILHSARETKIELIVVTIANICNDCRRNERNNTNKDVPLDYSHEVLKQDPAHQGDVDTLLTLGQETGERLSSRSMSPTTRKVVMTGLKRLLFALLKQRRHLQETLDPPDGLLEVRKGGDACSVCHRL